MLVRIIAAVVVVAVVVRFLRKIRRPQVHSVSAKPRFNRVARCERCSVYVPQDEAVHRDGRVYCSQAHAEISSE